MIGRLLNFPLCSGSIDGKHIAIERPKNSGSDYFNYNKFYSVVLLGVVNANYEFMFVDVGKNGRAGDAGVINETSFYQKLLARTLNVPQPELPPQGRVRLPYTFIADDAFALSPFLMKPYTHETNNVDERIFNYRLSRARRVVENAFGILSSRFRVLKTTIALEPCKVEDIVLACCTLHNFHSSHCKNLYTPPGFVDYETVETGKVVPDFWRRDINQTLLELMKNPSKNSRKTIKNIRNKFKKYFVNEGSVPWQFCMV